jgi:uncharacterized protein with NAD-binding domain and iron-sulfur cluster
MRILVLGAGPAGLAAAIRLRERHGDRAHVRLLTQGHLLGGKASTHRDPEGYTWEHGFHVFLGFYRTLWGLLRRAGVRASEVLEPNRGWTHFLEADGGFDSTHLSYNPLVTWWRYTHRPGLTARDRRSIFAFAARWAASRGRDPGFEEIDDVCFDAWAEEQGLTPAMVDSSQLRFTAEAYFNDPAPASAYVTMRSVQLLTQDRRTADYYYQRVGLSEGVWDPLGAYFERLGGTIERYTKVVGLSFDGRRVRGVEVATPDAALHGCGGPWPGSVPVLDETRRWIDDFDGIVCAVPRPCLFEIAPDGWDLAGLARAAHLRDVTTLTVQAYYEQPLPNERFGAINGLGAPLPLAVDYQQLRGRWATDPAIRSTMSWVGQIAGFEDATDDALFDMAVDRATRAGFRGAEAATPTRRAVKRNASVYDVFTLTEPGALRYRPRPDIGLDNLFLAGDWVRNAIDVPCMEGAATSGFEAADGLWERLR